MYMFSLFFLSFSPPQPYSLLLSNNGSFKKKVYRDLDLVEMCGFLHGVQYVSNNIFEVFLDIANF